MGGGIGMGNTCKPMAVSFLCMTKFTTKKKKESTCNAGDVGPLAGLGRYPGEGNSNPLQYSCLGIPMNRGAWRAIVHRVTRVGHDLVTKKQDLNFTHILLFVNVPHW